MNLVQTRRQSWNIGIVALVLILGFWRISQLPEFGAYEARTFILGILPIALLSMGQAVIIIGGGVGGNGWGVGGGVGLVVVVVVVVVEILESSFTKFSGI